MVRDRPGDKFPKAFRVVKFRKMTEFVDDDIFCERFGQMDQLVVKIQVPLRRTASPVATEILYGDAIIFQTVHVCMPPETVMDEHPCPFLVLQIIASAGREKSVVTVFFQFLELLPYPYGISSYEARNRFFSHSSGNNDNYARVRIYRETGSFRARARPAGVENSLCGMNRVSHTLLMLAESDKQ